ncbi:MAG: hypothetical protein E7437_03885 [Ruminococcaceae bacterium]|nr:hypothetical protein [Oscillospiraceae bacterium]
MKRILSVMLVFGLLSGLFTFPASAEEPEVTKIDMSKHLMASNTYDFMGLPVEAQLDFYGTGSSLIQGVDYSLLYENNVNMGTATVRAVGKGNYYGYTEQTFNISYGNTRVDLEGAYNGVATGELNDNISYAECYMAPGTLRAFPDCDISHQAYYALYHMQGEDFNLVLEKTTNTGTGVNTMFVYDFSDVYETSPAGEGEIYMLTYTWVNRKYEVYSGALMLYIPSMAADASELTLTQAEDGDFRCDYFAAYGTDGHVGQLQWTSSDTAVAEVNRGIVTWKEPGTVTLTAEYNGVEVSQQISTSALDITQGGITGYDHSAQTADVIYDGRLLTPGTDYTLSVSTQGNVAQVTVTGCGLFTGQLVREYNISTGEPLAHTHGFDNRCDEICNLCDFTRNVTHQFASRWDKNESQHWHSCTLCGKKTDLAEHTCNPDDPDTCTVCGPLLPPGDVNGDYSVNNKDVEYLLWYTLFPNSYPLQNNGDLDSNGVVNNKDVEYLLWHTLFPGSYPLN